VEHLRKETEARGLSEAAQKLMAAAERPKTRIRYESNFRQFYRWCLGRNLDPFQYSTVNLMNFLAEYGENKAHQLVQAMRSAINSTWKTLHPELNQAGEDILVKKVIKGKKETTPSNPKTEAVWDIQIVVDMFRTWGRNQDLDLTRLTYKTVMLLALVTMCRPRSELSHINLTKGVILQRDHSINVIIPKPKRGEAKQICIDRLEEDPIICPVLVLLRYMEVMEANKKPDESTNLFRTIAKPHSNASEGTVAAWITKTLKLANIDTEIFKPHSTRSASSTNAVRSGAAEGDILKRAGWSRATTFRTYYYRPDLGQDPDSTLPSRIPRPAKEPR